MNLQYPNRIKCSAVITHCYVKQHKYADAPEHVGVLLFFWKYRLSFHPSSVKRQDYLKPRARVWLQETRQCCKGDSDALAKYEKRLMFPSLTGLQSWQANASYCCVSIPQLALVKLLLPADKNLYIISKL